jgi:preprotein translocase subunit SecE
MARDRKRAKQRQRRAAQRQQPRGSREGGQRRPEPEAQIPRPEPEAQIPRPEPEGEIDPDRTIPDLEHGSAEADIAKAAIAAGAATPEEVSEDLDEELGSRQPKVGEIYPDEVEDDGYDSEEAEAAVEGPDGAAAAATVTARPRRERAARQRGGNRLTTFLRNSWEELKRVQWPDRRQVAQATAVVVGFVIIIGAYLGLADWVFGKLVDAII